MVTPLHPGLANALQRTLLAGFTDAARLLKLSTPLGPHMLLAECVRGEESLSRGYVFRIDALSLYADLPLRRLIGQPVLLELLTLSTAQPWRPFHGYVTALDMPGADGGLARYQLTVEPWSALLAYGRDSCVFQDKTVCAILDIVFAGYRSKGPVCAEWRYDLDQPEVYPVRSFTAQYQESDLDFAERLMLDEGLFYYFEHSADPGSLAFGKHVLVIANRHRNLAPEAQPTIPFKRHGAVMTEDSIDRWRWAIKQQSNAVELSSHDYRSLGQRPARAGPSEGSAGATGAMALIARDTPGAYAYPSDQHGQRVADNQLLAIEAREEVHTGLAPRARSRPA